MVRDLVVFGAFHRFVHEQNVCVRESCMSACGQVDAPSGIGSRVAFYERN